MPKSTAKKQYKPADDVDKVLGPVRRLRDEMRRKAEEEEEAEEDDVGAAFNLKDDDSDDVSYQEDEKLPAASSGTSIKKRRVGEVKSIKSVDASDNY